MAFISELAFYLVIIFAFGTFMGLVINVEWTDRSKKILYLMLGIALMAMAYSIWPGKGSDLSRYFNILSHLCSMSFKEALKSGYYNSTPITNIFMWLISKTGNNKLLPCISTGIIVFNIYLLIRVEERSTEKYIYNDSLYLFLIFSVATLLAITTGVRQNWMVTVYALAVYREYIKGKKDVCTILLYVASCMIHTSAIMLVFVRLCSFVRGRKKFIFFAWIVIAPLFERLSNVQGVLGEAVSKFYGYQAIGSEGLDIRYLIARMGILVVLAIMWWKVKDISDREEYINFYGTLLIISFGSVSVAHLFSRMANVAVYTSLPLLDDFYESASPRDAFWSKVCLLFLSVGLFIYHYVLIKNSVRFI